MGFRDIQAFNLMMLAKQAWRSLHHTHSLFYRVYKARHFAECSFMEAELGHNPSYVWWSLLAAREVIQEGFRWRVGNGVHIMAKSENWLSHKPVFNGDESPSLQVADLIDSHAWQWDRNKVADIFTPKTCDEIMAIPLSRDQQRDTLIWKENRKHKFTVKSAYQIALRLNQRVEAEH